MTPEIINGLFALAGASIGIVGTWLITRHYRERKQLQVTISPLARLLDIGDQIKTDIKILYKDQPIEALSMGEIAIHNTGTKEVQGLEMVVTPAEGSSIIDFGLSSSNFSYTNESFIIKETDKEKKVSIDFLNANDRFVIEYKLAGKRRRPEVVVRKLGVEVITKRDMVNWIPDIYSEVVYEAFSHMPMFNIIGSMVKPYKLYLESRRKGVTHKQKGSNNNTG